MTAVLAEAQLGPVAGCFHRGTAPGDGDAPHSQLHGFLEFRDRLGTVLAYLELQMTPEEKVRWC